MLDNITDLASEREVEFAIDLVAETSYISTAPMDVFIGIGQAEEAVYQAECFVVGSTSVVG